MALAVDGLNSDRRPSHLVAGCSQVDPRPLGDRHAVRMADRIGHRAAVRSFTSEPRSPSGCVGSAAPNDLGVISAAFFREATRRDQIAAEPAPSQPLVQGGWSAMPPARRPRQGPRRDEAFWPRRMSRRPRGSAARSSITWSASSSTRKTPRRQSSACATSTTMRLVRLGVIPAGDDDPRSQGARPRILDSGFAPDPFRSRR